MPLSYSSGDSSTIPQPFFPLNRKGHIMFGLTRNSRRVALALAFSAGWSGLAALPAAAQPGPGGDRIIHAIAAFKAELNLDTTQQPLWDAAVASGKAARDAAKQSRLTVKQVATDELAKATPPNLSHIAATADQVQDANVAAHRQVRAQWLALYATFRPDQVAVVKAGIATRMARMESFRERMRQRFGN
jgi:LTXXQ motif family protein